MKKLLILFLLFTLLVPKTNAQKDSGAAAAAVIGGMLAIGAGIAAIEDLKEQAELKATEWILSNRPELTSFSLKTLDFDGKKLKDMSAVSVITYKIQEFQPADKPELNGKKQILFAFTSHGWFTEYGIDFNKMQWYLIDAGEWMNMMTAYVKVASDVKDEGQIRDALQKGKIVNRGIKEGSKNTIPFFKMNGDMYVVTDYSPMMKFIYNERSLGIFLKETSDLVQIARGSIIDIHDFLYGEE